MSATHAPPTIELPAGARLLTLREVARRMGISVDTAERLLREGRLIAYTQTDSVRVHLEPAERYAVTAVTRSPTCDRT